MHEETKALFRLAIKASLPILQSRIGDFGVPFWIYKRTGVGRWEATPELRPDISRMLIALDITNLTETSAFSDSFILHHADHCGLIGLGGMTMNRTGPQGYLVQSAVGEIWRRHQTFGVGGSEVDAIVEEFSDFVDNAEVRVRFQAQLINFQMDADVLDLPQRLRIRRLSEEEVSLYHGGHVHTLGILRPRFNGPFEFVLEGEFEQPKLLGPNHPAGTTMLARATTPLNRAVLCLRTFKEGSVGYDLVQFSPVKFCPLAFGVNGCGEYIPLGSFSLTGPELISLTEHAKLIFEKKDGAMETAFRRLADAETRFRPDDRIVDSVIGMESLLLAGGEKAELSFRFSLNYSMLFSTPDERQHQYKVARDLYSLRSLIAHGSSPDGNKAKVAGEILTLSQAAQKATSVLRQTIGYFLSRGGTPYKDHEFWQRRYFGFPDKSA
jgi:hypothetical protein